MSSIELIPEQRERIKAELAEYFAKVTEQSIFVPNGSTYEEVAQELAKESALETLRAESESTTLRQDLNSLIVIAFLLGRFKGEEVSTEYIRNLALPEKRTRFIESVFTNSNIVVSNREKSITAREHTKGAMSALLEVIDKKWGK